MRLTELAIGAVGAGGIVGLTVLGGIGGHWLAGLAVFFIAMFAVSWLHQNDESPDRKGRS